MLKIVSKRGTLVIGPHSVMDTAVSAPPGRALLDAEAFFALVGNGRFPHN
ncbi:MAG: hypothetical protein P8183_09080 [Anaerolineae bacterium]